MQAKKLVKPAITFLVTIAIFVIIFSRIKLSAVFGSLGNADIGLFSLGLLFSVLGHIIFSAAKLKGILRILDCRISFKEVLILIMGSLPIKDFLPFKSGELSRVVYLKKVYCLSYPRSLASVVLTYLLRVLIIFLFISLGAYIYYPEPSLRFYMALGFLSLLAIFLLFLRSATIRGFLDKHLGSQAAAVFVYSFGFEACKLLSALLIFRALSIEVGFGAFLFFVPLTFLVASLPIALWGLGSRESAILFLFSGYASADVLLGAGLLISFANRIFPILLGLFFLKPFLSRLLGRAESGGYGDKG